MEKACEDRGFDFELVTTTFNGDLKKLCQRLQDENFTTVGKIVLMFLGHGNKKDQIESHGNI
jgi:hypothetical protein